MDHLFDKINYGKIPADLEFYFAGRNTNFFMKFFNLGLTPDNQNSVDFISIEYCAEIMRESKLSIHIETGNIYYDNMNTGESLYEFILNQQVETKKSITATLSYGRFLEDYLKEFLSGIDAETDDRFGTLTNKDISIFFIDKMIS